MDRRRVTASAIEQWEAGYLSLTMDRIVAGRNSIEHGERAALATVRSREFRVSTILPYSIALNSVCD